MGVGEVGEVMEGSLSRHLPKPICEEVSPQNYSMGSLIRSYITVEMLFFITHTQLQFVYILCKIF